MAVWTLPASEDKAIKMIWKPSLSLSWDEIRGNQLDGEQDKRHQALQLYHTGAIWLKQMKTNGEFTVYKPGIKSAPEMLDTSLAVKAAPGLSATFVLKIQ